MSNVVSKLSKDPLLSAEDFKEVHKLALAKGWGVFGALVDTPCGECGGRIHRHRHDLASTNPICESCDTKGMFEEMAEEKLAEDIADAMPLPDEFDQVLALTEELGEKEDRIIALEKRIEAEQKDKIALVKKLLPLQVYERFAPSPRELGRPDDIYDYFLGLEAVIVNYVFEQFDENGSETMAMSVEERRKLLCECLAKCHLNYELFTEKEVIDEHINGAEWDDDTQPFRLNQDMLDELPLDERREQLSGALDEIGITGNLFRNIRDMITDGELGHKWSKETQDAVVDRHLGEGEWWIIWEY